MPIQIEQPASTTKPPASPAQRSAAQSQILTVNVEDYFQAGVFHQYISPRNWYRFESRVERNTELTLALLAEHQTTATFFVLGWTADKYPDLVRRISDAGHEVASRGYLHQPLLKLSEAARREDLYRSKALLEDTIGREVSGFRLSDGWLTRRDLTLLNEIREAGYRYDSSLLPRRRDFHFQPHRRLIHTHETPLGPVVEVPPSTISMAGMWLPIAGGNYLRQLPEERMRAAVDQWINTEASPYVMYFQVWELDADQPHLSVASRLKKLRHYRNLDRYRTLLPQYLKSLSFTSIADHARLPFSRLAALPAASVSPASARQNPGFITTSAPLPVKTLAFNSQVDRQSGPLSGAHQRTAVTLVIPCYNEEASLPYLHRTLQPLRHELSARWDLKVLFVDDCSRDNTNSVLHALFGDDADIRIVRHDVNKGVSAAILTGIQNAQTDIVASMDCDCSYDPHELSHMLPLMQPGVAMVTASPYHRDGKVSNVPAWRLTLSHGLSLIYRTLLKKKLSTWTSCFRIYRKSQITDLPLKENGFLGTAELAAQLSLYDRAIVEHPATLEVRLFGFSKMKTLRTIASHLRLLKEVAVQKWRGSPGLPSSS